MQSNQPAVGRTTIPVVTVAPAARPEILPELLTTREAATLINCGERSLFRWSRSGLAPAPVRIGSGPRAAVRYRRRDLLAWLENDCQPVDGAQKGGSQ